MEHFPKTNSPSPHSASTFTSAPNGDQNDRVQPLLTSGFGAVIEKEHDLQAATQGSFGQGSGCHSDNLDRILRHHHSRLSANLALLKQRYQALPHPERFVNWPERKRPFADALHSDREETELLPELVAQHTRLLADIEALVDCSPGGQRGELILTEVSRSHEEMAWMLTALLKEGESMRGKVDDRVSDLTRAQENWTNEGGSTRIESASKRLGTDNS